ncbi:MAG: type 1 glutamine amidotransferase [Proteobacteria bacterium]|nr:type 1 glutamine amidotransferase [Pseudomonadota bacterium]
MKTVLVLQNLTLDHPAYLRTWLEQQGVPFEVRDSEAGQVYPERISGYGALAVLGGEMSANDDLPSLRRSEDLIRQAVAAGVPVIGHCLGGQLMARALGARVQASPRPEIGWRPMQLLDNDEARAWFGEARERTVYHWHSEAFELPPGSVPLATSPDCPHQAFAIGPHLAMQFHVELDAAKLAAWAASVDPTFLRWQREVASVQSGPAMLAEAATALPAQQRLAAALYGRWLGSAA